MGNVLNPIGGRTAPQHRHQEYIHHYISRHYQLELWSILILRAITEYICRRRIYEKGIENAQFKAWGIPLHKTMSDHIDGKPICRNTKADVRFPRQTILMFEDVADYIHKTSYGMGISYGRLQSWIILLWRTISGYIYRKTIFNKTTSVDHVVNLPEDLQCIIFSKLPLKDAIRTTVLSSKWRCLWTVSTRLRFDGTEMFGRKINGIQRERYTQQFISTVNAILQQIHGRVVEELVIKFGFDTLLVDHLNSWVRFATSSYTKFLAFDLTPTGLEVFDDPQYIFPLQQFDSRNISYLQHVQLHFVSLKVPAQFIGFTKIQKLDMRKVKITVKDFQDLLSNCCTLESLSIAFCEMHGELKVHNPLPCLLYLNVEYCALTKIELCAIKLRTFVYKGSAVPISFREVSELENVKIFLCGTTFADVIHALASLFANVKNLTLDFFVHTLEVPFLMENTLKLSHLKHLQLLLVYKLDIDNLCLVPFLGAMPFIEKLEIHFSSFFGFFYLDGGSIRRFEDQHNYLKDVCITGFKASNRQIEFLVHIVENSPALELLTVDQSDRTVKSEPMLVEKKVAKYMDPVVYGEVRRYVEMKVSPECNLTLLF